MRPARGAWSHVRWTAALAVLLPGLAGCDWAAAVTTYCDETGRCCSASGSACAADTECCSGACGAAGTCLASADGGSGGGAGGGTAGGAGGGAGGGTAGGAGGGTAGGAGGGTAGGAGGGAGGGTAGGAGGGAGGGTAGGAGGGAAGGAGGGGGALPTELRLTPRPARDYAGACLPLTVTTHLTLTGAVTPTPTNLVVNLSATPPGLQLWSDATCKASTASVTVPAGQSSQTFYASAKTGRLYTVTASSGVLTPGNVDVTINPVVRSGTSTFTAGEAAISITLSPTLIDRSRAMVFVQAAVENISPELVRVACFVESETTVQCSRAAIGTPVSIHWQVLEHRGLTVQSGVAAQPSVASTSTHALDAGVAPAESFVVGTTVMPGGLNYNLNDLQRLWLADAGVLAVDWGNAGGANPATLRYQVASLPGAWVRRGTASLGPNQSTTSVSWSSLGGPPDGGWFISYGHSVAQPQTECEGGVRAHSASAGFGFSRGLGALACTSVAADPVTFEVVDFGRLAAVQVVDTSIPNGSGQLTTLATPVDPTRTLALSGHQLGLLGLGESANDTNVASPAASTAIHRVLDAGTQLEVRRSVSSATDARWTTFVLQFDP